MNKFLMPFFSFLFALTITASAPKSDAFGFAFLGDDEEQA